MQTRIRQRLMCIWERSLLRPFLCFVLEAHVDTIRCFCSTLKSVTLTQGVEEEAEILSKNKSGWGGEIGEKERRSEEKNIRQRSL